MQNRPAGTRPCGAPDPAGHGAQCHLLVRTVSPELEPSGEPHRMHQALVFSHLRGWYARRWPNRLASDGDEDVEQERPPSQGSVAAQDLPAQQGGRGVERPAREYPVGASCGKEPR